MIQQENNKMKVNEKKRGRWKTGESGNPSGRPPGLGEVSKLRNSIAEHLPEIIMKLVNKAKEGDSQAARLLLDRVLPTLKPIEQPVTLILPFNEGITGQGMAVIQAVATGEIAPIQGNALLTGLGALARIKETDELERRINALEVAAHGT